MRRSAEEYFHVKPENLNCAQAVLKAYQEEFQIDEQEITAYKAWGGGRAKDGICGALFAAKNLLDNAENELLEKDFAAELGTIYCHELKQTKNTCIDCVRLADKLVEEKRVS